MAHKIKHLKIHGVLAIRPVCDGKTDVLGNDDTPSAMFLNIMCANCYFDHQQRY